MVREVMEIKNIIEALKESLEKLRNDTSVRQFEGGTFKAWKGKVRAILLNSLGNNAMLPLSEFDRAASGLPMLDSIIDPGYQEGMFRRRFEQELPNVEKTLENIIWQLETFGTPYILSKEEVISPKAFIAHGPESQALDKLCRYLAALGIQPLVIEQEPYESRSVNEQVEFHLEEADCAIVLGTADDKELKDGKLYPRRNVHIEIGRFQERFPNRTIYLREENATFPSNIEEKLYERFTTESMDEAFIRVAIELKAFDLIRASKTETEKNDKTI